MGNLRVVVVPVQGAPSDIPVSYAKPCKIPHENKSTFVRSGSLTPVATSRAEGYFEHSRKTLKPPGVDNEAVVVVRVQFLVSGTGRLQVVVKDPVRVTVLVDQRRP